MSHRLLTGLSIAPATPVRVRPVVSGNCGSWVRIRADSSFSASGRVRSRAGSSLAMLDCSEMSLRPSLSRIIVLRSMSSSNESTSECTRFEPPLIAGKWVVIAMFLFGALSTGGIWVYWKMHLAPFLPLQKAIAEAYPKSSPRVDGGWTKEDFRQGLPRLRIVLRVPYPPVDSDSRVEATVDGVIALAREHTDIEKYDEFEIYLVHYAPEKSPQQFEFKTHVSELK